MTDVNEARRRGRRAPVESDPLLRRLRGAPGSFAVVDWGRFARVIVDLDMSSDDNDLPPAAVAAALGFLREWSTPCGGLPVVGLATRELKPGERTIGYDAAIVQLFGLDGDEWPAPPEQGEESKPQVIELPSGGGAA